MSSVFVVFEGKNDLGLPNPAAVFTNREAALESYEETLDEGMADLNTGLYLAKLNNLDETQINELYRNVSALADEGFPDFDKTVIASYGSDISDWNSNSLSVSNSDFDSSDENFSVKVS